MAAATVSSAKRSLRAELKRRLRALSAEERLRQSRLLAQKVFTHSQYQKSKRISIFLSMQDEIETEEIIKDIFQQGKTCFIPRYQFQSNHMDMVKLASPEEISSLPKTSWNIHQPSEVEVREEALSTGSLLSSTTSEPVEMRVYQVDPVESCNGRRNLCSSTQTRPGRPLSTGSGCADSAAMAHGPSRSVACGIFPDRGTNPCPLHRQADSQPLHHQGSPVFVF
ncbi:5-formyltetrahydrofolate cyclo-ligase isoform X2 [Globicephala melas]|uniref:5-formyltetrahydrofolate cyclo-ligase isoform X2 n=1 Tax=Globicephala melas TaxID=9731 RepID=UPI00293D513B|nr:5-formyltetrahydrofolate cyclo-ligase isoform X2 [Globicephala melas]